MLAWSTRKWEIPVCKTTVSRNKTTQLPSKWKSKSRNLPLWSEPKNKSKIKIIKTEFKTLQCLKPSKISKSKTKKWWRRLSCWKWRIRLSNSNKNTICMTMKRRSSRLIMRTRLWRLSWRKRTRRLSLMISRSKSLKRLFRTPDWDP